MKIERLCGWHGFAFSRRPSGVYLTLGYRLVIFGEVAS